MEETFPLTNATDRNNEEHPDGNEWIENQIYYYIVGKIRYSSILL
jgi:hypothetical protein